MAKARMKKRVLTKKVKAKAKPKLVRRHKKRKAKVSPLKLKKMEKELGTSLAEQLVDIDSTQTEQMEFTLDDFEEESLSDGPNDDEGYF